jgi:hypothetical protein
VLVPDPGETEDDVCLLVVRREPVPPDRPSSVAPELVGAFRGVSLAVRGDQDS